jgi:hypothetical protein
MENYVVSLFFFVFGALATPLSVVVSTDTHICLHALTLNVTLAHIFTHPRHGCIILPSKEFFIFLG